jgi:hypothetical protein
MRRASQIRRGRERLAGLVAGGAHGSTKAVRIFSVVVSQIVR